MKKKQLKKRMKAKKRLTSAAVALLMSGSLLPVGNVFANEQSTQENSISSAEAKADLEKGMAVSGVENSTEAKQETQNTEKTSENSEDDKISIPETAREKRGDAQNASSEVLKKAEPEKSSDGRSILNISNFEQLKSAFNTPNISQVNLSNDIDFSSDITQYTNKNLVINGNGHTLDFRTHRIYATVPDGTCLTVENINTLTTGSTQPYAAFSLCTGLSTITLKDIKHVGTEFAWASNFIFEGNVDININIVGDGWTPALGSLFAKGGGTYKVSKNANVNIRDDINTYETLELTNIESILVESGAKFNIYDSAAKSYGVLHRIKTGFGIYVKEGGEFNIESTAPNTRAIYGPIGSIVVDPGGSINIKSNSDNTIDSYGQTMTIDLRNAKYFNLETTKFAGKAFNVGANSKIMFNSNVYAWNVLSSSIATSGWKDVDGVVELSGRNRTNVSTTNSLFDAQFKPQDYYRISSTGRLNPRIENTTINPVKDTDTAVSGKGEPNGKIEIKVGDQVIASGTVGSDGNYSLTIPKQSAGTVIKAVVSMDGQTSEANTTVVRTALAQTTISEINTETTQVSGKGEPNAPIKIMNGDQIIAQGVIGSDGNYTLTIPRQAKDSVIKAIVEKDGLTSEAQTTVKQGSLAQTTISEINTETTQVSGKGEPNAPIKIMNGDQIIAQGVIGSDGNYTLTIPKQAKDSVIKAIVEKDGLTSKAQTTVTQGSLVQTTISNIDTNTTSVSGKGEPNAKIELKVGNQVIASGRIGSDGNYSLTIPKQSVGTVVKAVVSANGLTSEAHTTVTRADLAPTTISKVDSQTTVITGTGEPGGKIELLNGNQLIAHGYVGKDGHYSLTVMKQPAGSTIVARVTMAGKESQASTVVEEKFNLQAPTIDPYYAVDANANGSITGDA
ncbi:Ig-like domain-containing protein, partial [Enterococcus hirae]